VALHVFLNPGHHEPARAGGLDTESVARLDPGRGGDRARDRYLVMRRHLCPSNRRMLAS
jgi:hypothetical protein